MLVSDTIPALCRYMTIHWDIHVVHLLLLLHQYRSLIIVNLEKCTFKFWYCNKSCCIFGLNHPL